MTNDIYTDFDAPPPGAYNGYPLFQLSDATIAAVNALSSDDLFATLGDMEKVKLLRLPFPSVAIRVFLPTIIPPDIKDPPAPLSFITVYVTEPISLDLKNKKLWAYWGNWCLLEPLDGRSTWMCLDESNMWIVSILTAYLIVSISTKNTVKHTSMNTRMNTPKRVKPQFRGPNGVIYVSRTLLDVPNLPVTGNGPSPRAHLRRGHIHHFWHGIGRTEYKEKWIDNIFVNADPNYPPTPKNYRVL